MMAMGLKRLAEVAAQILQDKTGLVVSINNETLGGEDDAKADIKVKRAIKRESAAAGDGTVVHEDAAAVYDATAVGKHGSKVKKDTESSLKMESSSSSSFSISSSSSSSFLYRTSEPKKTSRFKFEPGTGASNDSNESGTSADANNQNGVKKTTTGKTELVKLEPGVEPPANVTRTKGGGVHVKKEVVDKELVVPSLVPVPAEIRRSFRNSRT
jgi:hypothetical protein